MDKFIDGQVKDFVHTHGTYFAEDVRSSLHALLAEIEMKIVDSKNEIGDPRDPYLRGKVRAYDEIMYFLRPSEPNGEENHKCTWNQCGSVCYREDMNKF